MSTTNIKIKPNINNFYKNKVITFKSISFLIQLTVIWFLQAFSSYQMYWTLDHKEPPKWT